MKNNLDASSNSINATNDIVTALAEQNTGDFNLNDYILKTQVVPPVCPSCNDYSGAYNNCKITNDDETVEVDGSSNVVANSVPAKSKNIVSNAVNATGNIASSTVDAAGNVASTTVDAAGNVVSGTVDAAGDVVSGTVDAAGNVISSAVGAVGNVASSIVSAGSDVTTSASQNQSSQQPGQQPGQNTMNSDVQILSNGQTDAYSYYGQLPNKAPTEFIPITANFSSFGK